MSDAPGSDPLSHEGAWTEDAYLALGAAGRRIELIDGSLLVGPTADDRHARAVAAVRAAVQAALPEGLEITGPVALRLSPGRILVPDLVVAARSDSASGEVRDSSVALVVIDVVGVGHGVADRWFKPQLYAGSRIPYALLVDHDDPFAVGSMLIGGRYHEYAAAEGGGVLRLEEPFALELDLTTLAVAAGSEVAGSEVAGSEVGESEDPGVGSSDDRGTDGEQPDPAGTGAPDGEAPDHGGPDPATPDHGGPDHGGPDHGGADSRSGDSGSGGEPGSGSGDPGSGEPGPGDGVPENGTGPGHGRNGSSTADDGSDRSHPDEDHSVHA